MVDSLLSFVITGIRAIRSSKRNIARRSGKEKGEMTKIIRMKAEGGRRSGEWKGEMDKGRGRSQKSEARMEKPGVRDSGDGFPSGRFVAFACGSPVRPFPLVVTPPGPPCNRLTGNW
jgi:hypothetical protein